VAVTAASDDPASSNVVGRIPASIPRFFRADMERLVALRPDLVIVSEYTDADFLKLLADSGLNHHRMAGLHSLEGLRQGILELGVAVGEPEAARRLAAGFDSRLAELATRLQGAPRPRVLYWSNPFTAGAGTAIGSLIECGGGRNLGHEMGVEGVVPIGAERAFLADPDVVLVGSGTDAVATLAGHPLLSQMRAVRAGRIVELPTRLIVALSHHAADACWALASALHPDRVLDEPR